MTRVKNGRTEVNSERRKLILDIAAKLFARGGYSATTVRDIADEAGILSGSLYHHFSSKEAIIREVLEDYLDGLLAKYDEIESKGLSAWDTLNELIEEAFDMIAEQPDAVALYQNEAPFLQSLEGFEFLKEDSARIEQVWQRQIAKGQQEGDLRTTLNPALTYRFLRDAMWSTVRWYSPRGELTIDEIREQFIGVLHGVVIRDR